MGGGMRVPLSFTASHIKHSQVSNTGRETPVTGTILRMHRALKTEVEDQTRLFLSDSHVRLEFGLTFGLKCLCIYMRHEGAGETQ